MTWIAVAVVGGGVISGLIGAHGAQQAANTQADASRYAADMQWKMYNQNREDLAPWREAGQGVLPQLTSGLQEGGKFNRDFTMADFGADPGYQFRMDQGIKALERSRASRGAMYGGATQRALERYGQDYASGEYTNAFNRYMAQRDAQYNRLAGLAGTGQTATQQVAGLGQNAATNAGNYAIGGANARASGYVGQANALSGAVGSGVNGLMWMNYLRGGNGGAISPFSFGSGVANGAMDPNFGVF